MATSSKTIIFSATILTTIVAAYCATPDFSDYHDGTVVCADKKTIKLGFAVSSETKYLMNVINFKRRYYVKMYVRIAPKSDPDEVKDAQLDYEDTKKKIEEKHPDTVSSKPGLPDRRVIGIPEVGFGRLEKKGKTSVPCYYFVVEYADDLSDYIGGTIVSEDGKSIELVEAEKKRWRSDYNHTFKVKTFRGEDVADTFVRIAPLYDFISVANTIGDWDNTVQEIENQDTVSYNVENDELNKPPNTILSDGNGVLKKDGKDDIPCYYFVINYNPLGVRKPAKRLKMSGGWQNEFLTLANRVSK